MENVVQVASGNITSLFLFHDDERNSSSIILAGTTVIAEDENSTQETFTQSELSKLQNIPSTPFEISFGLGVAKVACGDLFCALLTVEGEVYTWGYNLYG